MSFLSEKLSKLTAVAQSVSLTKWYLDVLLDDGTVLSLSVGQISMARLRVARVAADFFPSHGQHVSGSAEALGIERGVEGCSCSAAKIEGETLRFQTDRIQGDLRFLPRYPAVVLKEPFLEHEGRQIRWHVEVPDADVTGTLRVQGSPLPIEGRGYRDRVEVEFTPWGLPLRMMRWSRAVAGSHAAVWVEATTARDVISCSWKDGVAGAHVGHDVCDASRPLLVGATVDLDSWRLGPLAPVIRKVTHDPYQEKRAGRAKLDGCEGVGVQELVRFRG
jgi:hypothetical protein